MKRLFTILAAAFAFNGAHAQITITNDDMPAPHDTFVYSNAPAMAAGINPGDSGANFNWNYALSATSQGMDIYKTTSEVSSFLSLPAGLYGYKIADSFPGIVNILLRTVVPGITIQNLYTYFEKLDIPSSYVAAAFSADVLGFPLGTNYTDPDVWYTFPLTYGSGVDSFNYALPISIPTVGGIKETGYRKTHVDGWGTITTPFYPTPVNCIRVRSEIHEIDSVTFGATTLPIPRNSVEYKWLVKGDHFPALWVTSNVFGGTETIATVKYRDRLVDTGLAVHNVVTERANVSAYPNPSVNGQFTLSIPESWKNYHVDVFDMRSSVLASQENNAVVNIQSLPAGSYVVRVLCGANMAFVPLVKQ